MAMPAAQRFLTCRSASSRSEVQHCCCARLWGVVRGGAVHRDGALRKAVSNEALTRTSIGRSFRGRAGASRRWRHRGPPGQGAVRATRPPSYVPRGLLGSKLPHRSTARAGWPTWLEALSTADCICRCTLDTMTACRLLPLGSRWRPRTGSGWPAWWSTLGTVTGRRTCGRRCR